MKLLTKTKVIRISETQDFSSSSRLLLCDGFKFKQNERYFK